MLQSYKMIAKVQTIKFANVQLRTLESGLPHFCNTQPDSDLLGSKISAWAEPDPDLKIILDLDPDLSLATKLMWK
jgi:hypothetical protein